MIKTVACIGVGGHGEMAVLVFFICLYGIFLSPRLSESGWTLRSGRRGGVASLCLLIRSTSMHYVSYLRSPSET